MKNVTKLLGKVPPIGYVYAIAAVPLVYVAFRATKAAAKTADEVEGFIARRGEDPNLAASIVNGAVELTTFEKGQTLGGFIYDALHDVDPNRPDAVRGPVDRLKVFLFGEPRYDDGLAPITVNVERR